MADASSAGPGLYFQAVQYLVSLFLFLFLRINLSSLLFSVQSSPLLPGPSSSFFTSQHPNKWLYRVSHEEWTKLQESVPYVELYRYNPKHLYPKLNGYGDNGHRKVWASGVFTYCRPSWRHSRPLRMPGNQTPLANIVMQWSWRDNASAAVCVKYLGT